MTIEEATAKVHEWLGTWSPNAICGGDIDSDSGGNVYCLKCDRQFGNIDYNFEYDLENYGHYKNYPTSNHGIPMPPAVDAMLARILRKLLDSQVNTELQGDCPEGRWRLILRHLEPYGGSTRGPWTGDPIRAAILACAEWLIAREQGK